jgi:hypothetical protein
MDAITDINGFPMGPVDFLLPPLQLHYFSSIIVPYELWDDLDVYYQVIAHGHPTGVTFSVAIKPQNQSEILEEASNLLRMTLGSDIYVWAYVGENLYLLTSSRSIVTLGAQEQMVPLAIVVLTILNLMFGNVMERRRDIRTFSTVGLSPSQVAFLFISEAVIYGILGSLSGYVGAMSFAKALAMSGMEMGFVNYASEWVATAVGAALMITVASSIYPSLLASRTVTPSMERRWKIPTKPYKNEWDIPLPFIVESEDECIGRLSYVKSYLDLHNSPTSPDFCTTKLAYLSKGTDTVGLEFHSVETEMRLIPYQLGIQQRVAVSAAKDKKKRWILRVHLTRLTGGRKGWIDHNRAFLDFLRKRLLSWEDLGESEKERYMETDR